MAMALMLYSNYSVAQKVKCDNDTLKVDGKPYAIMKKRSAGPMRSDYVVSALSGTELIYFKSLIRDWNGTGFKFGPSDELYYEANFIATGSKAELKHYTDNGFAKLVVENNLLKGNAIDTESEKRFILLNNGTFPQDRRISQAPVDKAPAVVVNINNNTGNAAEGTANKTAPAAPKSKSPVSVSGNKIIRDEIVIGKFRQDTTSSAYSQKTTIVVVYSEGGEKIAEASAPIENPQEWTIKILSEDKVYNIMYDSPGERESLFKWLADKNYLTY